MAADNNLFLDILSAWLCKDDPFKASLASGTIILDDGKSFSGAFAVACYICRLKNWPVLGNDELEQVQVQDLVLHTLASSISLDDLNTELKKKTFMVGTSFTLADIALYSKIYHPFSRLDQKDRMVYYHITRYFDLIQHLVASYYNDDFITRMLHIDLDAQIEVCFLDSNDRRRFLIKLQKRKMKRKPKKQNQWLMIHQRQKNL